MNEHLAIRKKIAKDRLSICVECDKYNAVTTQCKECGCIMLIKTILASSSCPLNKWSSENIEIKDTD